MMKGALPNVEGYREEPGIFIFEGCEQWIRTVPILSRDTKNPDDVDTKVEDHAGDETRYEVRRKSTEMQKGKF